MESNEKAQKKVRFAAPNLANKSFLRVNNPLKRFFASAGEKRFAERMMSKKLRFGLPKGSLQEATIQKMAKAGYNISVSSRSYIPHVDDEELEIRLIRAQEISRYVEHGYLDCGITGHDWVIENGSKVHEVGEFLFSKATRQAARWVLCVPEDSKVRSVKDLQGKRIATEVVNLTKKYLKKNGVKAEVEFSWGATEVKAHELVDAMSKSRRPVPRSAPTSCASWTPCWFPRRA